MTGFLAALLKISAQLDGVTDLEDPLPRYETDVWAYGRCQSAPALTDRVALERRETVKNLIRIQNRFASERRVADQSAAGQQQLWQNLQAAA